MSLILSSSKYTTYIYTENKKKSTYLFRSIRSTKIDFQKIKMDMTEIHRPERRTKGSGWFIPILPFHSQWVSPIDLRRRLRSNVGGRNFFAERSRPRSSLRIRAAFSRVRRFQRLLALASCNPATFVGLKDRHESRRRARRSQGRLARPKSRNHATSTCPTRLFSPLFKEHWLNGIFGEVETRISKAICN